MNVSDIYSNVALVIVGVSSEVPTRRCHSAFHSDNRSPSALHIFLAGRRVGAPDLIARSTLGAASDRATPGDDA
jgi:hypothetical protein